MRRLDLSFDNPAMNLALDEALLVDAENARRGDDDEVIRFWRFQRTAVVMGRGTRMHDEVDLDFCKASFIPVLRRCSGGASIVAGIDCLMYSVVISMHTRPELRSVDNAHRLVIGHLADAVSKQRDDVRVQGICDLTLGDKKFSGNSLRVVKNHLLYHGTILLGVDPDLVQRCLRTPPRQPDYRTGRSHDDFVTHIDLDPVRLCDDLAATYDAGEIMDPWPDATMRSLYEEKYGRDDWHHRH